MSVARPGTTTAAGWHLYLATALIFGSGGIVLIWTNARVGASIAVILAIPMAFLGGYCYRHHVVSSGRLPRYHWLWLKEDLPPEPPS